MKSTLSSKGQVTIPHEVRERLGLRAGTAVEFELRDGEAVLRKLVLGTHPVDRLFGLLPADRPVDELLDEMRGPRPGAE